MTADRRGPRLCLAGASILEHYPESLIRFITGLSASTKILLRSGNRKDPGLFEQVMAKLAMTLWLDVEWFRPDPEDGKAGVFIRDLKMVRSADLVLCYFSTTTIIGGTAHVLEKAQDSEVPVYAWGLEDGKFVRIGEHDPANAWGASVPA